MIFSGIKKCDRPTNHKKHDRQIPSPKRYRPITHLKNAIA
jgi:hypothetical protein